MGGIAPIRVPWLYPGQTPMVSGPATLATAPRGASWLSHYRLDSPPAAGQQTSRGGIPGAAMPALAPPSSRQDVAIAAAGRRVVVSAQGQLATYAAWSRSAEGRAYQAWRSVQDRLPEGMRGTGTWGQSAGLNGVLRGNRPQVAWSHHPAGQVWKYRCNVFATNHTYLAGFAVPTVTRPSDMVRRYEAEISGHRRLAENVSIARYFERVPLSQVRPGDWIICGRRRNGNLDYPHVVLATSTWQGGVLRIAQASATPKPDQTTFVARNGCYESLNDDGHRIARWDDLYVLRPIRLRPTGPDGRPVASPRG